MSHATPGAAKAAEDEWSSAELATLRRMRAGGESYARCARALPGRTRNACISKAWRMEIYAPPTGDDPRLMMARMPTMAQRARDWGADVIAHPSVGTSFLELGPRDCRWPFGDGRHMRFCGCPKAQGSPYCAEHQQLATEPKPSLACPDFRRRNDHSIRNARDPNLPNVQRSEPGREGFAYASL